ncbi:MAG: hypothetical protein HUJ98_14320, partial [Bacteroidaceae bacterium]|nr:hypothetical protein [Bacteroidaceae bacterium]
TDLAVREGNTFDEGVHSYERERTLLFGMIQKLNQDVEDLKKKLNAGNPGTKEKAQLPQPIQTLGPDLDAPYSQTDEIEILDTDEMKPGDNKEGLADSIRENEKTLISKALKKFNGRRYLAAEELGISERTLYRKIQKYGLE